MDETREVATDQSPWLDVPQNAGRGGVYPAWLATPGDELTTSTRHEEKL